MVVSSVHSPLPRGQSLSRHVEDLAPVSKVSRFIDDVWDFENEVRSPNARTRIYWLKIFSQNENEVIDTANHQFYRTLKEFAYARIFVRGAVSGVKKVKIQTVIEEVSYLSILARWLESEGKLSFADTTQRDLDQYVEWLKNAPKLNGEGTRSFAYVVTVVLPIPIMLRYAQYMDYGLNFSPWNGRAVTRVLGYQNTGENRTEIIPDEVMQPLYKLSIQLTQADVIDPLIRVLRKAPPRLSEKVSNKEKSERCKKFTKLRSKLKRHPLFTNLDAGERTKFYDNWQDLEADIGIVYAAFMVIIAGLSAMRDSEVRSLGPNSTTIEYDSAGQPKTYRVTGRTFKNAEEDISDEIGGEERTWVVIKEVHDALKALEKLATADPAFDKIRLFSRFGANSTTTNNLRRLLALAKNSDGSPVVNADGSQWALKTSQFRRSLARWIVWQPFGIIAGKNLFGHARITTTQGYAASDPSWNKLVAQEEAALIDEVMTDLAYEVSEGAVAGIKSKEILELFGSAGDRRFDDVLFYLKHNKKTFHVGPYSYCFYDPDRAACKPYAPADKPNQPITSSCSPDRCANACISRRHLPAWQVLASDLGAMLRTKGINDAQKEVLEREHRRIESIITPLLHGSTPPNSGDAIEG
ncbi:hypothetical protein [Pseudomonas sp. R37(2017)]|uniref:hypothetical protein n=1 Tax=Pseudomonas sp. R37(2017) TaxID=1981685 RepID=UPI000A1EBEB0|nr:hypothetical protein [Pseudomonas sp. R37(2017)]